MSLRERPFYTAVCDFPGCGIEADYGEYSAMAEKWAAIDYALDGDWRADQDGERHYCDKHPAVWDVDLDIDGPPALNYLLIHDSDGRVTLVLEAAS